jgi:iron-sulfur cluster repair protein YtfE (RIC family)
MILVHRAIGADLHRLIARLDELASSDEPPVPSQLRAISRYTAALLDEIRRHHDNEDEIVWPVLASAALQAVDLGPLTDDHRAIETTVDRVRQALGSAGELRVALGDLLDMLGEHMADEEQQVFPVLRRYVHADTYRWCERQARLRATVDQLHFAVPWLAGHARTEELRRLLAAGGWRFRILLVVTRPGYARLERRALGFAACPPDNRGVAL